MKKQNESKNWKNQSVVPPAPAGEVANTSKGSSWKTRYQHQATIYIFTAVEYVSLSRSFETIEEVVPWYLVTIKESARTLVVLNVYEWKGLFNVENTRA